MVAIGLKYKLNIDKQIQYNFINSWVHEDGIVNHSKNILDLIEKDDYVNGRLVLQVDYKNKNVCLLIPFADTTANTNIMWYGYEEVKSILTKEIYEQNCFKVVE